MYTDPDAVHHLLQMMTDAFIDFARLLQEAAEGDLIPIHCLPIVWMPPERGMALSEDLVVLVSPKLYKVFGRPYNEQIADTFGGVVIHSCGSTEHNLEILAGTRHLMGVNLSVTETALPAIVDALGKNAVALTHFGEVTCNRWHWIGPGSSKRLKAANPPRVWQGMQPPAPSGASKAFNYRAAAGGRGGAAATGPRQRAQRLDPGQRVDGMHSPPCLERRPGVSGQDVIFRVQPPARGSWRQVPGLTH